MVREHKNVIQQGDFATVKEGALEQFGFARGELVWVSGSMWDQSTTNPYNYRLIFIVGRLKDDHLDLADGGRLCDGKYLRKIKGKRAEKLKAILDKDFLGDKEDVQVSD